MASGGRISYFPTRLRKSDGALEREGSAHSLVDFEFVTTFIQMHFGGFPDVVDAGLQELLPEVGPIDSADPIDDGKITSARTRLHMVVTDVQRRATPQEASAATIAMHSLLTARLVRDGETQSRWD